MHFFVHKKGNARYLISTPGLRGIWVDIPNEDARAAQWAREIADLLNRRERDLEAMANWQDDHPNRSDR